MAGDLFRANGPSPDTSGWYMPTDVAHAVAAGTEDLARVKREDILGGDFGLALNSVVKATSDTGDQADIPVLAREHYRDALLERERAATGDSGPPAQADRATHADD